MGHPHRCFHLCCLISALFRTLWMWGFASSIHFGAPLKVRENFEKKKVAF